MQRDESQTSETVRRTLETYFADVDALGFGAQMKRTMLLFRAERARRAQTGGRP